MFRLMSEFLFTTSNQKNTEKQNTVCRHCKVMAPYNGNTTNVHVHLRHHSNIKPDCYIWQKNTCFAEIQANLPSFSKYSNSSSRAADINRAVAGFIVSGMRRLGIVDNLEFKLLLHKLDPRYVFPCRRHFAGKIIPEMYDEKKREIG